MRAGGGCVVADAFAERPRALTGRGCSKPGRRIGLIGLGRRPCSRAAGAQRITRSRRSRRRHHDSRLRLGVRVRDRLRCRSNRLSAGTANETRHHRSDPCRFPVSRFRPLSFYAAEVSGLGRSDASHEVFVSPSAHASCDALSGALSHRCSRRDFGRPPDDPASAFLLLRPARCCGTDRGAFARAVFRSSAEQSGVARSCRTSRSGSRFPASRVASPRRLIVAEQDQLPSSSIHSCR
jgi:hypothetical protein